MSVKKLLLAMLLSCSVGVTYVNNTAKAQVVPQKNEVSVQVYGPSKNGPLYKYASNVCRYSAWQGGDNWNLANTAPDKVYYNDGKYSGYLYRKGTWTEHNYRANKTRWVSVYEGNVRLVAYRLATNY